MDRLADMVEALGSPRVALVGDFMLDRWVYGNSERLSQEAPVPVLKVLRSEARTGGAGNVAAAVTALGARVDCIGVAGRDDAGDEMASLLAAAGADVSALVRVPDRPTTVKTRYVGLAQHKNPQQMLRVDREQCGGLSDEVQRQLATALDDKLADRPVVALQDHDKGVLTDANTPEIIARARRAGCTVVVDPALVGDYARYRGATLLAPNRFEAALASGIEITDSASLDRAARGILDLTGAEAVMVTLDKDGIFLMSDQGADRRLAPRPRVVCDGTGAGDAVLGAVAVALGAGRSLIEAVDLANIVGGLEVERFGVAAISRQEVAEELRRMVGLRGGKILLRDRLTEELTRRGDQGETVVFTNGCFDLLHMGHVRYLQQARRLGSCLVVAINSDQSVRRLKGPDRPVIGQNERAEMLGSLECVDYVTVFEEDTPIPLLELLRPDLLVKGGATDEVVGREVVEANGGKVMTLDLVRGLSTTEIINRIVANRHREQCHG